MKLPSPANDNVKPNRLLRYCELNETRGITYTRRHLYTLESEKSFPSECRSAKTVWAGLSRKLMAGFRQGPRAVPPNERGRQLRRPLSFKFTFGNWPQNSILNHRLLTSRP
jgi:hypothetical protein